MRVVAAVILASLLLPLFISASLTQAQEGDPLDLQVEQLMERMSTADKIGQLFLVSFQGNDISLGSDIADLIVNYKIGGVVLSTRNGNIINDRNTPVETALLTNRLQELSVVSAQEPAIIEPETPTPVVAGPFIPLFIATEHEGDAFPYTNLINLFTPVPSSMAIGASWNPEHARTVGRIVGRELSTVGINMLLGPSLDVLDKPRPAGRGDLGTRTYGGDPFWVGEMGRAYIEGVHEGSRVNPEIETHGRVMVVSKHFPGHGGSDRRIDRGVPVVQRTLEQLKQIELPPFIAATLPEERLGRTDALMSAHISFRGLGENLREQTKPISVDAQAMNLLLQEIPELAAWREEGGIFVSDALGAMPIQRFFDRSLQEFNGRRIAQDAFDAGNDLLYLAEYGLQGVATPQKRLANIKDAILHFRTRYEQDQLFKERVDASVRRILRLKLQMYPQFDLNSVQVDPRNVGVFVGQGQDQVFQIAKDAITLIAPQSANFVVDRPAGDERIVIFTDDRRLPDTCPAPRCQPQPYYIAPDALANTILKLYGPGEGATGDINPNNVKSFTFTELSEYLNPPEGPVAPQTVEETPTPVPPSPMDTALQQADWVVFAILDVRAENGDAGQAYALKQFLDQRDDLLLNRRVVVLAFNSPYFLDTTEISKLDAFYGVYSRVEPFIEASIRALFGEGEFIPKGASPVSIEGINYNLLEEQTAPNPTQTIDVEIHAKNGVTVTLPLDGTPAATPVVPQDYQVGDTLTLRTGVILDHNGYPVPDGTPVEFWFTYSPEAGGLPVIKEGYTLEGIAKTEFTLERAEPLAIAVHSVNAHTSKIIRLNPGEPPVTEIPPTPTSTPTPTPEPTDTPTPTPTDTPTPTSTPTETPSPTPTFTTTPTDTPTATVTIMSEQPVSRVDVSDLALVAVGITFIGGVAFAVGRGNGGSALTGTRLFLWSWILGMVAYTLYGVGLLGAVEQVGTWGAVVAGIGGGLLPLVVYALVLRFLKPSQWRRSG